MKRIETILVPIDFGRASTRALAYAVDLAEQVGAKVHVITAYEIPITGLPDGIWVPPAEVMTKLIDASQAALAEAVAAHAARKVTITSKLVQGDPRDAILEAAQTIGASLIVLGTHGRKGIARALIGSVAESVIRASETPVLTLH